MKNLGLFVMLLLFLLSCNPDDDDVDPPIQVPDFEGYTLQWSDEFEDSNISNLNWVYELGDGTDYGLPAGWGNDELQNYTNSADNSLIETDADGVSALVIVANEESPGNYSSAKLTTQGLRSFRYGKIDARIKVPAAQGTWPALWLLGDNITEIDWPGCGEIDIMEIIGRQPDVVHGTLHYTDADNSRDLIQGSKTNPETFDQDYHNFTLDWTPTEIVFSLDGTAYKTISITENDRKEFQRSFYLILNLAVGGSWPGNPDASTTFPQKMYVDYLRYYTKDDFTAPAAPPLDIEEETVGMFVPPSLAQYAFNSTLNQFPNLELNLFGAGGEPVISSTDMVVEGDSALLFAYPGGTWGGGWFEMETPMNFSAYASGNLIFSMQKPDVLNDAEIKLEAVGNSAAVFLVNYTPTPIANGYMEYTIPLADFIDLDFTQIRIPFALWNPIDVNGEYPVADVLLDNIYWEQ